ncbi:hypothetical protein ACP4OV_031618 [Aristida adscensionis]
MAAAGAPFSIREYAARARPGADGGSWPFGGDAGALPPMEVRRHRWWAEVAAAVEEEEAEVERRMAAKRRKRSVAELCAAVPRVVAGGGRRGKRARRRGLDGKERGKLALGAGVKTSKGKKKAPIGIGVTKKEKNSKVKVTSIGISQFFQVSKRKKELRKSVNNKKRTQKASGLLDKRSSRENKKSILDNEKKAMTNSAQVQSILMKRFETGLGTLVDSTDVGGKSKQSRKQKNVTFSVDIFGWTGSVPEDSTEQSQLVQTSQQPPQKGGDNCDTHMPQLVNQGADAISRTVEDNTSSISDKVVSISAGVSRTKPNERSIQNNSVDLNQCTEISKSSNCLNSIGLPCSYSQVPSQNFERLDSHLNKGLNPDASCLAKENHIIPPSSSIPVSLMIKTRSGDLNCRNLLSQPFSSCLDASVKVNDRGRNTLQERLVSNCHLTEVRSTPRKSCKYAVSSISSSTGPNKPADVQAMNCAPACRKTCFPDDYVGLPLNSRGEFVKVPPGGTPNRIDTFKAQCLGENSGHIILPQIQDTCTDHANLRFNHQTPEICTVDKSVFQPDRHFIPVMPTACRMDFRQLPNSERMEVYNDTMPCNKYLCINQRGLSVECFCSGCIGRDSPPQKLLGIQSCFPGQNTQPTAETTMRLMGKTVTLGTSSTQYRGLDHEAPCSSKQIRGEVHSIQRMCSEDFPMLLHGEMVDPPAFRIPNGERQPSKNPSYLSIVPAAEQRFGLDTSSFRTSAQNQLPLLTAANNLYVRPVGTYNEAVLGYQQPALVHQVQSNASEDMPLGSMHCRNTQSVATVSSFDRRNSLINFMETSPAPYESTYPMQEISDMTQMTPAFQSDAAAQITPGATNPTKFTSLPPLPPSVISSHVYNADYAQPSGSASYYPSNPLAYPTSTSNAPSDAIFRYENMQWTAIGSKPEGMEQMRTSFKRPAEQDDVFMTLPKKPCIAVQKDLNLSPVSGKWQGFCGSRAAAQPLEMPIGAGNEPEADLRLGRNEAHATWPVPGNRARPVKLKSGASHVLQPSMGLEISRPVHSITPFAVESGACTGSTSTERDAENYRF